jgi:3-dehydroquinate dehydratase/shikimate dehydrogenase
MSQPEQLAPAAIPARSRLQPGKVCVAIQAPNPVAMTALAEKALADAKFLEFRLDSLARPATFLPELKAFLAQHRDVTAIATCRRKDNGGAFTGSLASELDVLLKAAQAGCHIVDLEVESAEEARPAHLEKFREALRVVGTALLVSFHDFSRTRNLDQAARRIAAFEPDYVKVVSTAHALADNLAVLRLVADRSRSANVVGIAMGEEGLVSRILAVRTGAAFTFASLDEGTETAPGQVTARTMRDLYRLESIDAATRVFGVVGNPIAHSLSPLMHNAAFRREHVNAVMLPLKVRTVPDLLSVVLELPIGGLAVTMPLKQQILPHLANMDPLTAKIGACNTVRTGADGKLYGFNTDVAGVIRPLKKRLPLKGARIAVLGAGGAARAAVFGLVEEGAEVFIINRTHEHAHALAKAAKAKAMKHELLAKQKFDVIINSTPCGMAGNKQALPIKENELNARLVFDMVYNPLETPLLKLAASRSIPVISGIEMFVQQGARQFEIWTGKPAPEAEMIRAVELALKKRV